MRKSCWLLLVVSLIMQTSHLRRLTRPAWPCPRRGGLACRKDAGDAFALAQLLGTTTWNARSGIQVIHRNMEWFSLALYLKQRMSEHPDSKRRTLSIIYRNAPSEEKVCQGEQRHIARDRPANACLLGVWNNWSCSLYISVA